MKDPAKYTTPGTNKKSNDSVFGLATSCLLIVLLLGTLLFAVFGDDHPYKNIKQIENTENTK